jgi:hypothetical protein
LELRAVMSVAVSSMPSCLSIYLRLGHPQRRNWNTVTRVTLAELEKHISVGGMLQGENIRHLEVY